ncbi:RHS domain-containing protein [Xanthomonas oryzae pv. oryzicola]|uniref:RHS domain-containing protein n=1 Tax=Xanthomonas oryzae TaxID=347 RepID=UPI003D16DC12
MPSAQVFDRHASLGFAQEADDLLFGKTLLHVQSPRGRELDSKLRGYSNLGGRRIYHYQVDPNGAPAKVITASGEVVWSAVYSAWGRAQVEICSTRRPPILSSSRV